ncbi:MAG: endonuclease [Anaerolineae bacterium]|nr:endonuclease [Anaerolineae bacterium]
MDILFLIAGVAVGVSLTFLIFRVQQRNNQESIRTELIQEYEAKIRELERAQARDIRYASQQSTTKSRAILKGKMAEQIAPLLPGFEYWPADARFLGDPIDYVVFNGYSNVKDNAAGDNDDETDENLEVVFLDIKNGRATLTAGQRQIAKAVNAGRVRFEVVRVSEDGTIRAHSWPLRANSR